MTADRKIHCQKHNRDRQYYTTTTTTTKETQSHEYVCVWSQELSINYQQSDPVNCLSATIFLAYTSKRTQARK